MRRIGRDRCETLAPLPRVVHLPDQLAHLRFDARISERESKGVAEPDVHALSGATHYLPHCHAKSLERINVGIPFEVKLVSIRFIGSRLVVYDDQVKIATLHRAARE
jgi:hypothetical protein